MSREYAAEMRALIDAETTGNYTAPVVAAHIVERLRATDPDLLRGWLDEQATSFLRHAINLRDCSVRAHNRTAVSRSVFRQAAEDYEAGSVDALVTGFLGEVYVIEDGSKMRLSDMGRPERQFAVADYESRANQNSMQAAFLRAVDKKCGNKRTADVFSEEKLADLWRSISE